MSEGLAEFLLGWPGEASLRRYTVPHDIYNEHRQPNRLRQGRGNSRTNRTQAARLDEEPVEERVEQGGHSRRHGDGPRDTLRLQPRRHALQEGVYPKTI